MKGARIISIEIKSQRLDGIYVQIQESQQLSRIDDLDAVSQGNDPQFLSEHLLVQPLDGVPSQQMVLEEAGDVLGHPNGC